MKRRTIILRQIQCEEGSDHEFMAGLRLALLLALREDGLISGETYHSAKEKLDK